MKVKEEVVSCTFPWLKQGSWQNWCCRYHAAAARALILTDSEAPDCLWAHAVSSSVVKPFKKSVFLPSLQFSLFAKLSLFSMLFLWDGRTVLRCTGCTEQSLTSLGFLSAAWRVSTEALMVYSGSFTVFTSCLYFVVAWQSLLVALIAINATQWRTKSRMFTVLII